MAADIQQLIVQGDEALESSDLEGAERFYGSALTASSQLGDSDIKDSVLRALVKLAGRFIKQGVGNRPQSLYRHLESMPILERTRVMEWLARHHRQRGDLAEAEKIYLEIFDIKALGLGFTHEETTAALQTAALILQMQGKSPESLYLRALTGAKTAAQTTPAPAPAAPAAGQVPVTPEAPAPAQSGQLNETPRVTAGSPALAAAQAATPVGEPTPPSITPQDTPPPPPGSPRVEPRVRTIGTLSGASGTKPSIRGVEGFGVQPGGIEPSTPLPPPVPLAPPQIRPAGAAARATGSRPLPVLHPPGQTSTPTATGTQPETSTPAPVPPESAVSAGLQPGLIQAEQPGQELPQPPASGPQPMAPAPQAADELNDPLARAKAKLAGRFGATQPSVAQPPVVPDATKQMATPQPRVSPSVSSNLPDSAVFTPAVQPASVIEPSPPSKAVSSNSPAATTIAQPPDVVSPSPTLEDATPSLPPAAPDNQEPVGFSPASFAEVFDHFVNQDFDQDEFSEVDLGANVTGFHEVDLTAPEPVSSLATEATVQESLQAPVAAASSAPEPPPESHVSVSSLPQSKQGSSATPSLLSQDTIDSQPPLAATRPTPQTKSTAPISAAADSKSAPVVTGSAQQPAQDAMTGPLPVTPVSAKPAQERSVTSEEPLSAETPLKKPLPSPPPAPKAVSPKDTTERSVSSPPAAPKAILPEDTIANPIASPPAAPKAISPEDTIEKPIPPPPAAPKAISPEDTIAKPIPPPPAAPKAISPEDTIEKPIPSPPAAPKAISPEDTIEKPIPPPPSKSVSLEDTIEKPAPAAPLAERQVHLATPQFPPTGTMFPAQSDALAGLYMIDAILAADSPPVSDAPQPREKVQKEPSKTTTGSPTPSPSGPPAGSAPSPPARAVSPPVSEQRSTQTPVPEPAPPPPEDRFADLRSRVAPVEPQQTSTQHRYPPNWTEVALAWRSCGEILSDRIHDLLKAKLDKNTRTLLDKLRNRLPSFLSALEKTTAERVFTNTKRNSMSDRLDWMIAEELADLYKQWQTVKKRPYEPGLIYALFIRVEFLGPCHEDSLTTLHRLGHLYATDEHNFRNNHAAENLLRLSLLLHENTFGDNERRTVHNLISLANVYSENGAPSAAEPLFRRALDASTRSAALTQEELVELLRHFAYCSEQRGEFGLAAELYEKMRTIFEAISLDSSELFETIHNLVVCYDRSHNLEKARQYHQRLQWEIDWLDGPNSMLMREWCANRYERLGQLERAEQMNNDIICATQAGDQLARNAVQALVRIYEQMGRHRDAEKLRNPWYDPDKDRPPPKDVRNPIDAIHCAAQALRGGNLAEAKEYYQAALAANDTSTGISLQIVDGLRELGAAHWRNSQLSTALDIYRMAAHSAQRLLGSASADTASCLHEAGILEDAIGEPGNQSGEYFKQAFEIRLRLLGPDNIDTAESAYEYARHYKGDRECKESALKLAVAGRERHTGLCDDRTKTYVDELVRLYAEDGHFSGVAGISGPRFEFAEDPFLPPTMAKAARRYAPARTPGAASLITAGSDEVSALASQLDEKKFAAGVEAQETVSIVMRIIDLYEETDESPELWTAIPPVSHLFCALTLQLVAHHFMSCGDYARASATFDTVLRIREEVMGRSHPDAAMSLCDLAALATRTREYRDAERLYTRAAEIFESRLGESNIYTAAAYHNLAVVLHKRKRKQQAALLYRKVLELLERSGSTEGSRKLVCIKNLESLGFKGGDTEE